MITNVFIVLQLICFYCLFIGTGVWLVRNPPRWWAFFAGVACILFGLFLLPYARDFYIDLCYFYMPD